ncbi:MAG: MFS transporter [Brevinematales bacterium]|jgi:predicted MFS family arabinose efflux permease
MRKIILSPAFILIFLENFFFFSSRNSLNMLPPYLASLGASKAYTGFFMNISSLLLVVFVLFFTGFASRLNKKYLLTAGFSLQLVSLILMFFCPRNLNILLIFQFLSSFSYAFGFTINSSIAFDIIPPGKRTSGIALFGLSGVLAAPTGSFFGEIMSNLFRPNSLFILSAFFCLLSLILVFFIHDEPGHGSNSGVSFWKILKNRELSLLFFLGILLGGAWSVLTTFIPDFTSARLGFANLSFYFFANSVIAVLSRTVFAKTIDNISRKRLIITALTLIALAMLMTSLLFLPWQLYAIGVLYGLGHSILYPVLNAAFVDSGKGLDKFALSNAFIAMYTLGNVALCTILGVQGDFIGSFLGNNGGLTSIFISMGLLAAACVPMVISQIRENKKI